MNMLRLENFCFDLGGRRILDGLNFSLTQGDYLAVIGPNGAGKSTFLKCLMRLHERGRAEGRVLVQERPLAAYSQKELARAISYVPQAGGWIPPFTVEEFLRLSRYSYMSIRANLTAKDLAAVRRALDLTEMADLAGRPLRELSGGERQRAFLGAALAQETDMMLLDEPASFLDPKHAADLAALLALLNREEGLTMITVTHDLNHPLQTGGLTLVLREGRQLFFGPAEGLLQDQVLERAYQHQFTYFTHPKNGCPAVLAD